MSRNTPIPRLSDDQKARIRAWLIHEDAALLAFDKPAGVPVQTRGNRGESLDHLLWAFAKSNGKRPRLVHRIDAETSGVLLVARTQPAAAHLSESFAERRAQKTYLALVRGDLPEGDKGVIEAAIARRAGERGGEIAKIVDADAEGAKLSRTAWRVLARKNDTALMQLSPETGRMHQIRVHLAYIGCPILGDRTYGAGRLSAERCMLHASGLVIPQPGGGTLDLAAPLPSDFIARAEAAGLDIAPLAQAPASS
jgi:23S rRNA pseudouridine955/2504/2580 synthase